MKVTFMFTQTVQKDLTYIYIKPQLIQLVVAVVNGVVAKPTLLFVVSWKVFED
jgi:hypothetical protein